MINRIRDIRRQKGLTLADVAARCTPPTTAQTIGRLETGTRSLSLAWMNRIGGALGVDPQVLVAGERTHSVHIVARITAMGTESLVQPQSAILPDLLLGEARMMVVAVEASAGDYRAGDQIWLRQLNPGEFARALNRDVLAPRPAGRFVFGRLIDRNDQRIAVLPPGAGQRQVVVDHPAWLATADVLVRQI